MSIQYEDNEERLVATSYTPGDDVEVSLRPRRLEDYLGQ